MKLTQKYNQIVKDSRVKEYHRLCELYGEHNVNCELGSQKAYHELRHSATYSEIIEYLDESIHGYYDPYKD